MSVTEFGSVTKAQACFIFYLFENENCHRVNCCGDTSVNIIKERFSLCHFSHVRQGRILHLIFVVETRYVPTCTIVEGLQALPKICFVAQPAFLHVVDVFIFEVQGFRHCQWNSVNNRSVFQTHQRTLSTA